MGFFQEFLIVIGAVWNNFQPGFGGFVALHIVAEEHGLFAAFLDERGRADVPSAGQIVHGRVVVGIADDEDGVEIFGLHESIEVGFHVRFLLY